MPSRSVGPAARFGEQPLLALPHLRDLRSEIDALLVFLRSDSKTEKGQEDAHRDQSTATAVGEADYDEDNA